MEESKEAEVSSICSREEGIKKIKGRGEGKGKVRETQMSRGRREGRYIGRFFVFSLIFVEGSKMKPKGSEE